MRRTEVPNLSLVPADPDLAGAELELVDMAAREGRLRDALPPSTEVVERVREHIRAGDAFQVVLAQRFEAATTADALDLYRVLRATNPSPYMYLLRFEGRETPFDVVGSSPEALVTVTGTSGPAASTAPRTIRVNSSVFQGSTPPPPRRVTLGTGQPKFRSM